MVGTHPSRRKSTGFTLIELLIVIAIIAILAAILFPVFAQARAQARKINAVSMVKQVGLAWLMYVQDNDETFPRVGIAQLGVQSWPNVVAPYIKNQDIVADPACSASNGGTATYVNGYLNIIANDAISHTPCVRPDGRHQYGSDVCGSWGPQVPQSLANVNAPADYVMLVDGYAPWAIGPDDPCGDARVPEWACKSLGDPDWTGNLNHGSKWKRDVSMEPYHVVTITGRTYGGWSAFSGLPIHGEGTPVVFGDGHAKWIRAGSRTDGRNTIHSSLPFRRHMVPDQANVDLPDTLGLGDYKNGDWIGDNWQ